GGRPSRRLYRWAVSSRTNVRSNTDFSFRRKCPCGTRSSIVTICICNCIRPASRSFILSHFPRLFNFVNTPLPPHCWTVVAQVGSKSGGRDEGSHIITEIELV